MNRELESELEEEGGKSNGVTPVEIARFAVSSLRRHPRLAAYVAGAVATLGVTVSFFIPPKYDVESRILAVQSALVTSELVNNNRQTVNTDPFQGSTEILMKKSNLQWMVQQSNLLSFWEKSRPAPLLWKDAIQASLFGKLTESIKNRALADMLERQMYVTHDPSVLTIHVMWPNAEAAYRIAKLAQDKFLTMRKEQELSAITAAISVNEEDIHQAAEGVDQALKDLIRAKETAAQPAESETTDAGALEAKSAPRVVSKAVATANKTPPTGSGYDEKKLTARVAEVRQQIRDIEGPWQRNLAELKLKLMDMRATYGPEHPAIVQQEARIKQATESPSELARLRNEEHKLLAEAESAATENVREVKMVAPRGGSAHAREPANPSSNTPSPFKPAREGTFILTEKEEDPLISPAKASLTAAIKRYDEAKQRLDKSRLELATSQASLEYRYTVVSEPERPQRPTKNQGRMIGIAAILGGALLGLVAAVLRDLVSGKVYDPWQIRMLGIPVIGELEGEGRIEP